jgi:molybdopterin synthase sulfur carrier subunit
VVKVSLTANLQKYFPQRDFEIEAKTVLELLKKMDETRPQFSHYVLEDDSRVRKHVNIFIDGELLDKHDTKATLKSGCQVHIMQALSGG